MARLSAAPTAVCALHVREAARARIAELGITYDTVDAIAGFTTRYTSKLLSEPPAREFTVESMFALLGAIALMPTLQPDNKRLERLEKRPDWKLVARDGVQYRIRMLAVRKHRPVTSHQSQELRELVTRLGGLARARKLGKRRRRQIARAAAAARWAKREMDKVGLGK